MSRHHSAAIERVRMDIPIPIPTATSQILSRLLALYGSSLTISNVAAELHTTPGALHSRRSRGTTGGLPEPIPGVTPYLYRAVDIANWLVGDEVRPTTTPDAAQSHRKPGRPRRHAPVTGGAA